MYITQADIENRFGRSSVAKWSQLEENDTGADTARIALAIAYGESYVNAKFRGHRYAVPFQGTDPLLVDWCAIHAGVWLYASRGQATSSGQDSGDADRYNGMAAYADSQMAKAISGTLKLDLALKRRTPTTPVVIT